MYQPHKNIYPSLRTICVSLCLLLVNIDVSSQTLKVLSVNSFHKNDSTLVFTGGGINGKVELPQGVVIFGNLALLNRYNCFNYKPLISSSSNLNSICSNEKITLTASAGINYLWSTGATTQSIDVNATEHLLESQDVCLQTKVDFC